MLPTYCVVADLACQFLVRIRSVLTVVFLLFDLDKCLDKAVKQFATLLSVVANNRM